MHVCNSAARAHLGPEVLSHRHGCLRHDWESSARRPQDSQQPSLTHTVSRRWLPGGACSFQAVGSFAQKEPFHSASNSPLWTDTSVLYAHIQEYGSGTKPAK